MSNFKRPFAILAVLGLICIVGIPAWAISKRGAPSAAMQPISGSDRTAQRLFQTNCGACHTLAAAGTDGVVGPDLDVILPNSSETKATVDGNCTTVLSTINTGIGGRMPAGIIQGEQAELVANFVARNLAYVNGASTSTSTSPASSSSSTSSSSTSISPSQVKCQTGATSAGAPSGGAAPPSSPAAAKPKAGAAPAAKQAKKSAKKAAPSAPSGPSSLNVAADPSGQLKFTQSSLTANTGNVKVDFTNQSPLQHDFCIQASGGSQGGCTSVIQGSSTSKAFNLKPGSYTFYCSVDGHEAAGMKGTLTVK